MFGLKSKTSLSLKNNHMYPTTWAGLQKEKRRSEWKEFIAGAALISVLFIAFVY